MGNTPQNKKMSNTRNWGSMHSEFAFEFKVWSNHDHSTLEITFCSAQNLFCSHRKIRNCPTLEIGVQCHHNLHGNSQYSQIMTILPQKLLFAVHRNIIRYFHFGYMGKKISQITAIITFPPISIYCWFLKPFLLHSGSQEMEIINYFGVL